MYNKKTQEEYYLKLMNVAACQLKILNIYEPKEQGKRLIKNDSATHQDIKSGCSRNLITIIQNFQDEIHLNKELFNPGLEYSDTILNQKLFDLKELYKEISKPF